MKIDRASSTPSYVQLAAQLKAEITAGTFSPGSRLPTETELVNQSQLSRITVRRGLELLEKEGWVVRRQGLGTFVRDAIRHDLSSVQTLTEVLLGQGITPRIEVLSYGAVRPPEPVRQALRLNENEQLLLVKRLYCNGSEPVALVFVYLPLSVRDHADVLRSTEVPTETTYTIWEQKLGIRLRGASHTIHAARANDEDAAALNVNPGDPILVLDRITYAEDGRPLEYITFHYHWERYKLSVMVPRINMKNPAPELRRP